MQESSVIEERDQEYERAIKRAATQEAKSHVLDVLAVVEQQLARIRWNVDPGHDGKHLRLPAIEQGEALIEIIREVLPDVIDISYRKLVQGTYDEDSQPLGNEDSVVCEVQEEIERFVGNLKVKP